MDNQSALEIISVVFEILLALAFLIFIIRIDLALRRIKKIKSQLDDLETKIDQLNLRFAKLIKSK